MISPLESNGIISRAQDISIIQQNEDARGELAHLHTQSTFEGERDQFVHMYIMQIIPMKRIRTMMPVKRERTNILTSATNKKNKSSKETV